MSKKNTEPYLSTYFHTRGRKLGLPIAGNFELTARCNFNCPMCYVHLSEEQVNARGRELTAQQWLQIAKEARDKGMIFALLTGGEPLMRKDFFEIYRGMKEMGLLISINSNGSLLQGEILEQFLADPPARFNISLYGGSNATYERMCGRPVYDRVRENIRTLRRAGVEVSLNLSITPYNCDDMASIHADALDLGANVRFSSYMYPPVRLEDGKFGCGNRLSAEAAAACSVEWDLLRFSEEEFAVRAENMAKLTAEAAEGCSVEEGEGIRCRAGSTSFWVTWDGRMLPCGMMTEPEAYPLEKGFSAAWEQLKDHAARVRMPAECTCCEYEKVCGVCAAVCFTETGRFDGVPEYVCRKTKEQVRLTAEAYGKRSGA